MPIHDHENNYDEIIPNLFLGNYLASKNKYFIKKKNIKGIINVTIKIPNYLKKIDYLRIPVENKKKYINIFKNNLENIVPFVDKYLDKNKGILIHCKSGHRRSVCVVAYYLMKKYNIELDVILKYIKKKRPTIFDKRWKVYFYDTLKEHN